MEVIDSNSNQYCLYTEEEYRQTLEALTDQDIAVFDGLGTIPIKNVHAEAYITLLCMAGKGTVTIEGTTYEIHKNDIVIGSPHQFIEDVMVSCDFQCRGLLMSPQYFRSIFMLPGNFWEAGVSVRKIPVIHLNEEDTQGFVINCDMLKYKLSRKNLLHHDLSIKLLLQSLIYEFYDVLAPKLELAHTNYSYSSAELLFKRFAQLIADEAPRRHDVNYYANKLCITPKYLSAICKKQYGHTASEAINQATLSYVKQMLRNSDKSIKEIAADTGFDNLSFFGKYVKRELGMSPREYRTNGE